MPADKMDTGDASVNEKDIYEEFQQFALESGETWFLLSSKWIKKWKSFIGIDGASGEHPGPIDNSGLLQENSNALRKQLVEEEEFLVIPKGAWQKLMDIYTLSEGQEPIARKAITTGSFTKQITIEIYLPLISMKQHDGDETVVKETFSRATPLSEVHKRMKELFEIPEGSKTRVYIEDSVDAVKETDTLDEAGVGPDQMLVLEKQNNDETWLRSSSAAAPPSYSEATSSPSPDPKTTIRPNKFYNSSYSSYENHNGSSYSTRSSGSPWSASSRHENPGLCGLSNLGNTCFMNSAIQCLSNVPLLTLYFLEKMYKNEINRTNPIGMKGKLAEAYADLIHNMWSGHHSSVAPREFKYKVSSFAPQFSGYQQHDSQELLAFLIDGLHEDLNRIAKKPYIELKDSGDRPDSEVAMEAWNIHRQRNNSVIVDMFHGLFKSTIVCPDCKRVSITFDPFGFLSLPLPRPKDMSVACNFVPRDPKKPVSMHKVSVPKDGVMKDLAEAIASKMQCKAKRLVITEVYSHRFYKVYCGTERLGSYLDRDDLYVFQLGYDEDDDGDDVDDDDDDDGTEVKYVKVLMRRTGSFSSMRIFAHPFLIPVKSGVTTYQKLYNAILEAVSRYIKREYRDDVKMLSELEKIDMNSPVSADATGNDTGDINKGEQEIEECGEGKKEVRWFNLVTTNSTGTTVIDELTNNDKPINFTGIDCISAEWNSDEYIVAEWSKTFERDPSLTEKPKDKGLSVQECMRLFTTKEMLGEHDLWYCPSCKEHKQATKKFDLWELPPILIIHLKRFSYTRWSRSKLSTFVDFPTRDLDLSDFVMNPAKGEWEPNQKKYNLIGVSNHYGGMGGGHYTAYALNYLEDKWYYFDDSSVTGSSKEKVKTNAAYMLMYQRQDMEDAVRTCGKEALNFLVSRASPGSHSKGFAFDENVKATAKPFSSENEKVANHEATPMDTS